MNSRGALDLYQCAPFLLKFFLAYHSIILQYGRIVFIAGSSNGRTVAFEAINRGSSPCPAVRREAKNLSDVYTQT